MSALRHSVASFVLRLTRSFSADERGGAAPIVALALIPTMFSVGAAVDYSRASSARTAMQGALDATVLAATRAFDAGASFNPEQYFNANLAARKSIEELQLSFPSASPAPGTPYSASARGTVKTMFLGPFGFAAMDIQVRSTTIIDRDEFGCVLSLDPSVAAATKVSGSASVTLTNCSLFNNSADDTALSVSGSATVNAMSVGVVGGATGQDRITTQNGVRTGIKPVADPYADVNFAMPSGCNERKFSAKGTITIDPGVYCDGFSVNADADVTLNPGIYVFDQGTVSVNGGAKITGKGVTLVFTSSTGRNWATMTVNGGATINLTPPQFGPTQGIVVFGDRRMPAGTTFRFNGGTSQYFGGAVYVPTGEIDFSGGVNTGTNCTQLIGGAVSFSGNSSISINCSSYKTRPFGTSVVRLTS